MIELINCKECGAFIVKDTVEVCNRCQDPYYLEEHHGG